MPYRRMAATAISLGAALLAPAGAQAEPTPVTCVAHPQARVCEVSVLTDGPVAYVVSGVARIAIFRNGTRRTCVEYGGHGAGNLQGGTARAGDMVRVTALSGDSVAAAAAGTPAAIADLGFTGSDAC